MNADDKTIRGKAIKWWENLDLALIHGLVIQYDCTYCTDDDKIRIYLSEHPQEAIKEETPKDLFDWIDKVGLPSTSDILSELKALNAEREAKKEDTAVSVVSLQQMAVNYAGDRNNGAGFGYPSFTAGLIEKGFLAGTGCMKEQYRELIASYRELLENCNALFKDRDYSTMEYINAKASIRKATNIINNLK